MDGSSASVLWYRRLKPQGKVRRRVQDLRIPSSSLLDFKARIDLSHNESARMAVDSLLSCGLEEYNHVLNAEGEVDFLSQPEKIYILENGWDGRAADPGAADDRVESLSADSQGAVHCPVMSTDSGSPAAVDTSTQKGVKKTDCVLKPSFEIYFQSDRRAPGMKDLVREFMQKATVALAIVMDSFSDVELLCDLLGASRKRNVSVHLLLDHLNLNLFISMWQELRLDSKNFPKLSVRSVDGQTYCAKTGRKLTGQIVESFIITDWTEVLTGSYSFSWLSWQVHRSLAVLVKGSAVIPFHEEFHRLNSSSKEIPGFVNYITVPLTVPKLQNNTSVRKSENAQAQARKVNADPPRSAGSSTQLLQSVSAGQPQHAVGAVCILAEPLEDDLKEIQSHQCSVGDTHSSIQSQLCNLTVGIAAESSVTVPESNPVQTALPTHRQHRTLHRQTAFNANSNLPLCNFDLFCRQSKKDKFNSTLRTTAVEKTEARRWLCPPTPRTKVHLSSDYPKAQFHSTSQHKVVKTGLFSSFPTFRGHICGTKKVSTLETWRHHQPHLHSHLTTEPPSSSVVGTRLHPSGSKLLSPGNGPMACVEAPPRLNPTPLGDAAKPRLASRHKYLSTMYQTGWRPFHSRDTALTRSKSLTERRSAGLTGADLIPT